MSPVVERINQADSSQTHLYDDDTFAYTYHLRFTIINDIYEISLP